MIIQKQRQHQSDTQYRYLVDTRNKYQISEKTYQILILLTKEKDANWIWESHLFLQMEMFIDYNEMQLGFLAWIYYIYTSYFIIWGGTVV